MALFADTLGARNSATIGFKTLAIQNVKKKFKNPYAGWIWAASGTSLFGTGFDLAWIFAFFEKSDFSNAIREFGDFCEYVGPQNLRCLVFFDIRDRPREKKVQESLRWLDLGRLREVTFWVRARFGVDFRLFSKILHFRKSLGNSALFANKLGAKIFQTFGFLPRAEDAKKTFKNPYAGLI